MKCGTLSQIRDEMVAGLEADGCSAYHVRDVKRHITKFLESFGGQIGDITSAQLSEWLRNLTSGESAVSGRTRDNYRDSVHNFFNFARNAGYLPIDLPTAAEEQSASTKPEQTTRSSLSKKCSKCSPPRRTGWCRVSP